MRKAMICITVMLAMVQLWPMVFGQKTVADVASPAAQAAVVIPVPQRTVAAVPRAVAAPIPVSVSKVTAPSNCFAQYKMKFAACAKGDVACGGRINDQWDLCEATGFWPE